VLITPIVIPELKIADWCWSITIIHWGRIVHRSWYILLPIVRLRLHIHARLHGFVDDDTTENTTEDDQSSIIISLYRPA
jgi:hypothetical protein